VRTPGRRGSIGAADEVSECIDEYLRGVIIDPCLLGSQITPCSLSGIDEHGEVVLLLRLLPDRDGNASVEVAIESPNGCR